MATRVNSEVSIRFLRKKAEGGCEWWQANASGHMAPRALIAGSRGAETPTAREEWGGYARREWLLLLERERVAEGASSATEMPIPTWMALKTATTVSETTEMAQSICEE